jgi:hypothetical protein
VVTFACARNRTLAVELVGALALTLSCTSTQDFFKDPPNLAGRSSGAGSGTTGGKGGAPGTGGSSTGGSSAGGSAAENQGGRGGGSGGDQAAAAGSSAAAGSGNASAAGSGGDSAGNGSFIAGGSAGAGGSGGSDSGAAGDTGAGGEAATGGTSGVGGGAGAGGASGGTSGTGGTSGAGSSGGGSGGVGGAACVPEPERCDGVSNDCDDDVDEGDTCPVGCQARQSDGHLYLLCMRPDPDQQLDYDAATAYCEDVGSSLDLGLDFALAEVGSKPENDFLKDWISATAGSTDGMVWMAANDLEQERKWVWGRGPGAEQFFTESMLGGGMPVMMRFNDWADGRPNATNGSDEDCGSFDSEFDWQWNDLVCGTPRLGLLCEQTP